jgi:hypothetical protein
MDEMMLANRADKIGWYRASRYQVSGHISGHLPKLGWE